MQDSLQSSEAFAMNSKDNTTAASQRIVCRPLRRSGQPQWASRASSELTGCEVTGLISESSLHSGWEYWSRSEELVEVALSTLLMINAEQQVIEQIGMSR